MARALLTLLLACVSLLPSGPRAAAAIPDDRADDPAGLDCTQRVALPAIANAIETKWSPDGTTLAVVWFGRVPSERTVSGYREEEILDVLDIRTGTLGPVGVGDRPQWSGSGRYLSYWGPNADELRVVQGDRVVARLESTIPEARWAGDTLFFIAKDEIRTWTEGTLRTVARFAADMVPRYPRDDVYFSPDGERFTLTRYALDGGMQRYVGLTDTAALAALDADGATYMEWAPVGSTLLLRYAHRIVLRDLPAVATTEVAIPVAAVHGWTADGKALLVGRVSPTVPGGDAFDAFQVRWPAGRAGAATLPNVMGARSFSRNGRYFVGVVRDGRHDVRLEVYRCGASRADLLRSDPDARARMERIGAGNGRFVRPVAGDLAQFMQGSHAGIDVAAPFGSLVVAADDGVVDAVGWIPNGGSRVCVQHAAGLESCYFHTSSALVALGDRVSRGQPIALVGMTGLTTGPHVHWEAKLFGRLVDPLGR